jgi:hypothetical protein
MAQAYGRPFDHAAWGGTAPVENATGAPPAGKWANVQERYEENKRKYQEWLASGGAQ